MSKSKPETKLNSAKPILSFEELSFTTHKLKQIPIKELKKMPKSLNKFLLKYHLSFEEITSALFLYDILLRGLKNKIHFYETGLNVLESHYLTLAEQDKNQRIRAEINQVMSSGAG